MTSHISQTDLERYRARELRGDALLNVNRHLGSCESCRAQYGRLVGQDSSATLNSMLNPDWLADKRSVSTHKTAVQPRISRLSLAIAIAVVVVVGLALALVLRISRSQAQDTQTANGSTGSTGNFPSQAPSPEKTTAVADANSGSNRGSVTAQTIELKKPPELALVMRSEIVTLKGPGGDKTFSLLRPVGTFLLTTQPTLTWSPVKDAVKYEVSMRPVKGTRSIFNETTTETSFTPKAGMLDPYRNQVLQWSVTAQLSNGSEVTAPGIASPEALFLIASEANVHAMEEKLRQQNREVNKAALLANAGFLDEAERELVSYSGKHSDDSTAKKMLATVKSWRGQKRK